MSYVWAKQFFASRGDATKGHKVFDSKKCAVCHNDASSDQPGVGAMEAWSNHAADDAG